MDLEIIRCVKGQLLNLVGQSIAYHGFNDPIVYFSIDIGVIVNDVACVTKTEGLVNYEGMSPSSGKKKSPFSSCRLAISSPKNTGFELLPLEKVCAFKEGETIPPHPFVFF